jgi:hypothetical protein
VSKRVRGGVRTHRRPGARPPTERSAGIRRTVTAPRPSQLEAAEVIAEDIVEEQPAAARTELERVARSTARTTHHRIKPGSILAARAATEYVYVAQDMRRILLVAGALIGFLFALWLAVVVLKVIPLPFY